ncbi:MAG: hypothetical protein K9K38_19090 [Rhodoferax sp.]|nr:hypothetical protein [Rhodoferax sp.]
MNTVIHFAKICVGAGLAIVMLGCQTSPTQTAPAKPELAFVDIQGFDRDLTGSLSSPLPKVDVTFYDRIVPSALPVRLQTWIASVESGGGSVKVVPPKSNLTSKSPFMLIGAISSLWSASKTAKDMSTQAQFNAAKDYDAEIILKVDDHGDSVVDKVVFVKRSR